MLGLFLSKREPPQDPARNTKLDMGPLLSKSAFQATDIGLVPVDPVGREVQADAFRELRRHSDIACLQQ